MKSINVKEASKKTVVNEEEHHQLNIQDDQQNNQDDVTSKNNKAAVENLDSSINDCPMQVESMGPSSDVKCQEGVKKSRRRRRHSFQSSNYSEEGGGSTSGSESLPLHTFDSSVPGAYQEGGNFAGRAAPSSVWVGQGGGHQGGEQHHRECSGRNLIDEGNGSLLQGQFTRPSHDRMVSGEGSWLHMDTDLDSLVPADSTPDVSRPPLSPQASPHWPDHENTLSGGSPMAVVQAHVVVEQPFEERFAAEIEARVQAELQDKVQQEVNRTLGAIATAEVVVPHVHNNSNHTPGDRNDILPGYHRNTKTEIVDIDEEEGVSYPGDGPFCTKKHLCISSKRQLCIASLLLLLIAGAVVTYVSIGSGVPYDVCQESQVGSDINGEAAGDLFGWSVALSDDGNCVAIGAYSNEGSGDDAGHVRIFEWSGSNWTQAGPDLNGKTAEEWFGFSVALSADGKRVAIGAPSSGFGYDAGHVRIFDRSGSEWILVGSELKGKTFDDAPGKFGNSVALAADGNRVAIGAPIHTDIGYHAGYASIYDWSVSDNNWTQVGSNITGEAARDFFGFSIALSANGNRVAIGGNWNDGNGKGSGHVRIFELSGSQWVRVGSDLDGEVAGGHFGYSVSLSSDGNRVSIGAPNNDGNGENSGHVRIFEWSGSDWTQVGSDLDGEEPGNVFGKSVSLSSDGNRVAIGAVGNGIEGNYEDFGYVRILDWSGSQWVQVVPDLDGKAANDWFGRSVALSADGNCVAVGVSGDDQKGDDAGKVVIYNLKNSSCL